MRFWPLLLLAAPYCAFGSDCGLRILVLDATGASLPYRVHSFKPATGGDQVARFRDLRAESLPCGIYTYQLRRTDTDLDAAMIPGRILLEDLHQMLTVEAPPTLVVTPNGALSVDGVRSPDYRLRGVVKDLPKSDGPTWIRLLSVSSNRARDIEVNVDGSFELFSPTPGEYLILVLQKGRVLAAQHLVITSSLSPSNVEITVTLQR